MCVVLSHDNEILDLDSEKPLTGSNDNKLPTASWIRNELSNYTSEEPGELVYDGFKNVYYKVKVEDDTYIVDGSVVYRIQVYQHLMVVLEIKKEFRHVIDYVYNISGVTLVDVIRSRLSYVYLLNLFTIIP